MKGWLCGVALLSLAACQPGAGEVRREAPVSEPVGAAPEAPVLPVVFPKPIGPVANYLIAELPITHHGRWSESSPACADGKVITVEAQVIVFDDIGVHIRDIEVNQSGGQIIDLIATTRSGTRIMLKLSVDGAWLQMTTTGPPLGVELPDRAMQLGRCA